MALSEIQQDFIGAVFRATIYDRPAPNGVVVDVSGASTKQLHFEKPDGTGVEKTAAFYTDGTDGIIQYTTVSGDLNAAGTWSVQAYIVDAAFTGHSDKHTFTVVANLATP